ncbi:MAG: efflux RND transporter periplasmic adaptor subunit [Pirellulaceae bacterium]
MNSSTKPVRKSVFLSWLWTAIKFLILASAIGGGIFWLRTRPTMVENHRLETGSVVAAVMGTGTLEAHTRAQISSKISGRIKQVLVDQGERVKAGDLLVELDSDELEQQVAIAEADLETRKAAIQRLEADVRRTEAIVKQSMTNHDRIVSLVEQKAVSREELDKAAESLAVADADKARAEAALVEGQQALVVSERSLEFQKTRLEDTHVHAPFEGLIVRRDREQGDVVVPGAPVLQLISTSELWINAWVDETEMAGIHPEQKAEVIFRSAPDSPLPGRVVRLAKETDRETREFVVDVQVLDLPENWAIGQRAEVYIETGVAADVLRIRNDLLEREGNRLGVYVDEAGVATWRDVEIGLRGRDFSEVRSGLEPDDQIVAPVNEQQSLAEGRRVIAK